MKTLKNSKLLFLGLAVTMTLLLSSFLVQPAAPNKYVTMRVYEFLKGSFWDSKIIITYEDGHTEEYPLGHIKSENLTTNAQKITATINSLAAKGYELAGTTGSEIGTYIFTKK